MNEFNSKIDALLVIAANKLVEKDVNYLHSINTSDIIITKKLDRKIRRRIRIYDKRTVWSGMPIAFRRVVAAALVFCTVSFCACMSVSAVREAVWGTILKWYDKFVSVFYVTEETPPTIIEEYREPQLHPAKLTRIVAAQSEKQYVIIYNDINNNMVMVYQQFLINDKSAVQIDNEDCTMKSVKVNLNEGTMFIYKDNKIIITWHDNNYAYILQLESSLADAEAIIQIAESVK